MERQQKAYSKDYVDTEVVKKIRAGKRRVLVIDKDGTIQRYPHPVANPSVSEMLAGAKIRRITAEYPFVESSAQVLELSIDSESYKASVRYGFNRPRPNIRLPDGTYTRKPEEVAGWSYLLNPDAFIGFGTGIYLRRNDGYVSDSEFDAALGGPEWRPRIKKDLDRLYPDGSYKKHLGRVDQEGLFPDGVDVDKLAYRLQFDHLEEEGVEGSKDREKLWGDILMDQLKGGFKNAAVVDESNPGKRRFTTYLISMFGQKERALERFGNQLSFHADVPMSELEFISIGDSPTDLISILDAFYGASEVVGIVPANSRLSQSIHNNEELFAGVSLPGSPNHPTLPGRYFPTDTPGVYWWQGRDRRKPRKVILAGYTPWGEGMECTESVLATLEHLGF